MLSLSVTDEQIPLFGAVLDGNTAEATTYGAQWLAVSGILGRSDFLFLGDSKLATRKNLREIIDQQGIGLAATPLTSKLKRWLRNEVARGKLKLRPFEPIAGQLTKEEVAGYTYTPRSVKVGPGAQYRIRQLIIRSEALAQRQDRQRQKQITACLQGRETLHGKLNRYQWKTPEQRQKAVDTLGGKYPLAHALRQGKITKTAHTQRRLCGPGRPGKTRKYRTLKTVRYRLAYALDKKALACVRRLDGIFIRVTHASVERLPDSRVWVPYKDQWKVERQHYLLKGPIALTPVFWHKPKRIAALTLVCLIAMQVLHLMEWQAQQSLAEQHEKLLGWYPNKIATDHPPALRMIEALSSMPVITMEHKKKPAEY